MVTWKLIGWLRMTLMAILAMAPLAAQHRAPEAAARCASPELQVDVDGDGRADRVRWMRYDDAYWLDVTLAGTGAPDGLALRSTTRVAPAGDGERWSISAEDVDHDGKMDVLVRDAAGRTTAWISDGLAFAASPSAVPTATPVATQVATQVAMLCAR